MDQELLRQLHEADFPPGKAITVRNGPSLEELIDAFGDAFDTLRKDNDTWEASASVKAFRGIETFPDKRAIGATPEEAVAKLWLALNSKGV